MAKILPDERVVYLALKNTFKGADAQLRKAKKIREVILRRQHNDDVRDLIREHNIDDVCNVARALLEQQIFESTLKAKTRFPEVFEVSPAQSAERSASEAEAARTEADAIRVAAVGKNSGQPSEFSHVVQLPNTKEQISCTYTPPEWSSKLTINAALRDSTAQPRKRSFPRATVHVPSLYPVYLPYQTQHQLLAKVQSLLEKACYDFGVRTLNQTVDHQGWDCAEAAELNRWPRVFLDNQDQFLQADLDGLGKPFAQILDSIVQLRHTAVHRLRINANRLEQFMIDAESLARLLRDDYCLQRLTRLRMDTQLIIGELKRNKDLLESKVTLKLQSIAAQRAQLDHLEQTAVDEMMIEDKEYQVLAGANFDQAINSPDTVRQSEAPTEVEVSSEADFEADLETDLVPVTSSDQDPELVGESWT